MERLVKRAQTPLEVQCPKDGVFITPIMHTKQLYQLVDKGDGDLVTCEAINRWSQFKTDKNDKQNKNLCNSSYGKYTTAHQ